MIKCVIGYSHSTVIPKVFLIHLHPINQLLSQFLETWDQIDFVMESPEAKEKYVRRMLNWVAGQNNLSRIQLNRLTALRYFLPDWHREQGFSSKLSPNKLRMSPTEVTAEIILVLRGYDDFLQQTMNHHLTEERSRLKNVNL